MVDVRVAVMVIVLADAEQIVLAAVWLIARLVVPQIAPEGVKILAQVDAQALQWDVLLIVQVPALVIV